MFVKTSHLAAGLNEDVGLYNYFAMLFIDRVIKNVMVVSVSNGYTTSVY